MKLALFLAVSSLHLTMGAPALHPDECTIHVSPHGSLHQAAHQLTQHSNPSDVVMCLDPGLHLLQKPLLLNVSHNHKHGGSVTWRPSAGAGTATVSGGAQLTKWYRCDDGVHCPWPEWHGVWVHMVSDISPAVPGSMLPVRQLWVNGSRISRASTPLSGWVTTASGYSTPSGLDWVASSQVELRWPSSIRNWIEPRCLVTGVTGTNLTVDPGCWTALTARAGKLPPPPLFAENIPGVPGPGEFYATDQYIFYRPAEAMQYTAPADAWVPVVGTLLQADGLTGHTWQGIAFKHATWRQPSLPGGYVPSQTAVCAAAGEPVGAVNVSRSLNISFDQCSFTNIGAAYALSIGQASQKVRVTGNRFVDCSGGAVKLGNVNDARALSNQSSVWDSDMVLDGNWMDGIAMEFRGAAAVFAGYVADTTISQNTIQNTGYTGISLGWGWGTHVSGPQTFAKNNHITGNRLTGIMSALNDGGCTYTLGPQPGSTVSGNYCQQDRAPVVGCFYHDNGSRFFSTFNNVADSSPAPCVYLQGCCNSPAYDIAVSKLWCRGTAPVRNGCAAQNCTIDAKSLFVLEPTQPWPAAAQAIIDAAGADAR